MHSLPIHSSTFSFSYWYSFLNWSNFMVWLYWGLNLLHSVSNRPFSVLHVSFSAVVSISKYCRLFLLNQFWTSASLSVCGVLYVERILLTSHRNVLTHCICLARSTQMLVVSWWDCLPWVLICHAFFLPEPLPLSVMLFWWPQPLVLWLLHSWFVQMPWLYVFLWLLYQLVMFTPDTM